MDGFRKFIKGTFGKVLLGLIFITFVFWGVEGVMQSFSGSNANVLAKVAGSKIGMDNFERQVQGDKDTVTKQLGGDESKINMPTLKQLVLERMVGEALLENYAAKQGIMQSDKVALELATTDPAFQDNGKFSSTRMEMVLRENNLAVGDYVRLVQKQVARQQIMQGLGATAFTTPKQLNAMLQAQLEKRNVWVASIAPAAFAPSANGVTDSQAQSYYNAHKDNYITQETMTLQVMSLNRNTLANKVQVNDAEVQALHAAKKADAVKNAARQVQQIVLPFSNTAEAIKAKNEAQKIAALIKPTDDFAAMILKYSKDPAVQYDKGDLGLVTPGTYGAAYDAALAKLQAGQISAPFKTENAYIIAKVLAVQVAPVADLSAMRAELNAQLQRQKLDELYYNTQEQIKNKALEANSLSDVAKEAALTLERVEVTPQAGTGLFASQGLRSQVFVDDITADKNISAPIEVTKDQTIWVQALVHKPSKKLTFAEAKPKLQAAVALQLGQQKALAQAQKVQAAINAGQSLSQVQAAFNVSFVAKGLITRQELGQPALAAAAFGANAPAVGKWAAAVAALNAKAANVEPVNVVAINQVVPADGQELAVLQAQMGTRVNELKGQYTVLDLIAALKADGKVKLYQNINSTDNAKDNSSDNNSDKP